MADRPSIEFFFDVSSPWTYLAFHRFEAFAEDVGADIVWRPFLLGGVFNKVNPSVYQRRENPIPAKDAHYRKSMEDWAAYQGITIGRPSVFPLNSVKALRGAFVAIDEGKIAPYARACFEAYSRYLGERKHSARPWMEMPITIIRVIGWTSRPRMLRLPRNQDEDAMATEESGIRAIATSIEFSGFHLRTICVMATTKITTTNGLTLAYHSGL